MQRATASASEPSSGVRARLITSGARLAWSSRAPSLFPRAPMPASESSEAVPIHVQHEPEQSRYSATVDGQVAVAAYQRQGDVIVFTHTEVPSEIEGRGVATALARRALDDAREAGAHVIPRCAFFVHYMDEHPEYDDLRAKRQSSGSA